MLSGVVWGCGHPSLAYHHLASPPVLWKFTLGNRPHMAHERLQLICKGAFWVPGEFVGGYGLGFKLEGQVAR